MKLLNKTLACVALAGIMLSCSKEDTLQDIAVSKNNSTVKDGGCVEQSKAGDRVIWTQVVHLSPEEEVANVVSTARGIAILRLTESMMLHSKIIIMDLPEDDNLLFAHIHEAPAGVNGPVVVTLAATADDFGVNKSTQLTQSQFDKVMNSSVYVNAHSTMYPPGLVRGQIR